MTISSSTIYQPGQDNGAGATDALFRTKMLNTVIADTKAASVFTDGDYLVQKTDKSDGGYAYHVGTIKLCYSQHGDEIPPQSLKQSTIEVKVDTPLAVNITFSKTLNQMSEIADVQIAMLSKRYADVRAKLFDTSLFGAAVNARSLPAKVSGNRTTKVIKAGNIDLLDGSVADSGAKFLAMLDELYLYTVENNISRDVLTIYVSPQVFGKLLMNNASLRDKQFGGQGSLVTGSDIGTYYMGIRIKVAPYLPTVALLTDTAVKSWGLEDPNGAAVLQAKYRADFSKVLAVVMTNTAALKVTNFDLSLAQEERATHQATSVVMTEQFGLGIVDPASVMILTHKEA